MYRCEDCGRLFTETHYYRDETGEWDGCPYCGGVPALLVECKTCNNEVPEEEVSDEGLCQECQQEVLKRFQHYMAGLQPEERAYLNHVFDGEAV